MNSLSDPIAVVGAGIMGRGIARVSSAAGFNVRLYDTDPDTARRALNLIRASIRRATDRTGADSEAALEAVDRIQPVEDLSTAVSDAALVIEAAPEDLSLKKELFNSLAGVAPEGALLATNTSSLSVTAIASAVPTPGRVIGLHFFNPVHRMDLVEIVVGLETDDQTVDRARRYCTSLGKTSVTVQDRAGFVTSRVNAMIGNEAFHMLMEGVASADDIDVALKHGLNHPMGPFELVDLVGLDTRLSVLNRLRDSLGERFRPNPLLVDYVAAGRLGRKVGRGVFAYDPNGERIQE